MNRHFINPFIHGINFGSTATRYDLRAPLNRSGVNSSSLYNWKLEWQLANNATTRLSDTRYASGQLELTVPAQSVTLLVLPNAAQ